MAASLDFEAYGEGIAAAWTVLREQANRAGLDAPVPTCPEWTVRDLVAHQCAVHRWAAATVRGERVAKSSLESLARAQPDLLAFLDDGARDLLQTLDLAEEDLDAWFFLPDAPPARLAWARRQCHETTVHAVDAMGAARGRVPRPAETWIRSAVALDGVDELLTGFVPRGGGLARLGEREIRVAADGEARWTVTTTPDAVRTRPGADGQPDVSGPAVELYLALWNRAPLEGVMPDPALRASWTELVRVG